MSTKQDCEQLLALRLWCHSPKSCPPGLSRTGRGELALNDCISSLSSPSHRKYPRDRTFACQSMQSRATWRRHITKVLLSYQEAFQRKWNYGWPQAQHGRIPLTGLCCALWLQWQGAPMPGSWNTWSPVSYFPQHYKLGGRHLQEPSQYPDPRRTPVSSNEGNRQPGLSLSLPKHSMNKMTMILVLIKSIPQTTIYAIFLLCEINTW